MPRTGWVKRGIPNPEVVAAHMYRSQFIAYDFAKAVCQNPDSFVSMMMIHDLPEARAGDISPHCGVTREEKAKLELQSAEYLAQISGNPEFLEIFQEYEEKHTIRAQLCHDADQLECVAQALEYGKIYPDKWSLLEDFWPYANDKIVTELGRDLYNKLDDAKVRLESDMKRSADYSQFKL